MDYIPGHSTKAHIHFPPVLTHPLGVGQVYTLYLPLAQRSQLLLTFPVFFQTMPCLSSGNGTHEKLFPEEGMDEVSCFGVEGGSPCGLSHSMGLDSCRDLLSTAIAGFHHSPNSSDLGRSKKGLVDVVQYKVSADLPYTKPFFSSHPTQLIIFICFIPVIPPLGSYDFKTALLLCSWHQTPCPYR